jgi:hypothetical protein
MIKICLCGHQQNEHAFGLGTCSKCTCIKFIEKGTIVDQLNAFKKIENIIEGEKK